VSARPTVWESDASGIDDKASINKSGKRHVRVTANKGLHLRRQLAVHLLPPVQATIDEYNFIVVSRCGVTEENWPETINLKNDVFRHPLKKQLVRRSELRSSPDCQQVVSKANINAARHVKQLPVGITANENDAVTEGTETIEDLRGLWPPGVIAGHSDDFGVLDGRLCENSIQRQEDSMNIRQNRNARNHDASLPGIR
jgi:hypothetical protein